MNENYLFFIAGLVIAGVFGTTIYRIFDYIRKKKNEILGLSPIIGISLPCLLAAISLVYIAYLELEVSGTIRHRYSLLVSTMAAGMMILLPIIALKIRHNSLRSHQE